MRFSRIWILCIFYEWHTNEVVAMKILAHTGLISSAFWKNEQMVEWTDTSVGIGFVGSSLWALSTT